MTRSIHALMALLAAGTVVGAATAFASDLDWTPVVGSSNPSVISASTTQPMSDVRFGIAMASSGDELIISGDSFVLGGFQWASPEVWRWSNRDGWTKRSNLTPFGDPIEAHPLSTFGASLAASATWAFVAESSYLDPNGASGAVHCFRRSEEGEWAWVGLLIDSLSPSTPKQFGACIAFDGLTLAIGVPGADLPTGIDQGRCDLYAVGDRGPIFIGAVSVADSGGGAPKFGERVAVDGNTLVLSAPAAVLGSPTRTGQVAIFRRADAVSPFTLEAVLSPLDLPEPSIPKFGEYVALDGERLVISSHLASTAAASGCGVAWVYQRVNGRWLLEHTIAGDTPGEALGPIDLDGDLLATGSPGNGFISCGCKGWARLYSLANGEAILVASETSAAVPPYLTNVGEAVWLGEGRWAYSSRSQWIGNPTQVLTLRRVTEAAGDCDRDGIPNGIEVTQGGATDMNNNLVPDECDASLGDCDESGTPDLADVAPIKAWCSSGTLPTQLTYAISGSAPAAMIAVSRIVVPTGTDGTLRGIVTDLTAFAGVSPMVLAVYADPNQDGDPSDAALLWSAGAHGSAARGEDRFTFAPIEIGAPGTTFFIGLIAVRLQSPSWSRIPFDTTTTIEPRTWIAMNTIADFNLVQPYLNQSWQAAQLSSGYVNMHVAGLFAPAADANFSGIPDACECPADLNGDGTVGPLDLAALLGAWGTGGGDADGDGSTGPTDLALLLGAWGEC